MPLSIRQKSNIRHFVYYLVNGTLDFELIQETFGRRYYEILQENPELFYKTACVFINQEYRLKPSWPNTKKSGKFICQIYTDTIDANEFNSWEMDFTTNSNGFSSGFKNFTTRFTTDTVVEGIQYKNYIRDGASFVEQCFAIWSNVVTLSNDNVTNQDHAVERVQQYIKSYYIDGYADDLDDWECELHFE